MAPVVVTRSGGPEHFVDGANGLVVPTRDPRALADAMEHMIVGGSHYSAVRIRRDIVARFGVGTFRDKLTSIYERVISG